MNTKGKTDNLVTGENGYSVELRVLASDNLTPATGATIELTLIGPDGGDGGFVSFETNSQGIATANESIWPGRYQVNIRAPENSQFLAADSSADSSADFSAPEKCLVVCEDGSYSPSEFRIESL